MDKKNDNFYNSKKVVGVIPMSAILRNNDVANKTSKQTLNKMEKVSAKEMRKKLATPSAFGVKDISLFKQGK